MSPLATSAGVSLSIGPVECEEYAAVWFCLRVKETAPCESRGKCEFGSREWAGGSFPSVAVVTCMGQRASLGFWHNQRNEGVLKTSSSGLSAVVCLACPPASWCCWGQPSGLNALGLVREG